MQVRNLAAQHNAFAERFKLYEQQVGELPPVEVLNELRYALRAAIEFISQQGAPRDHTERERELLARMDHALKCGYHDLIDGLVIELVGFVDNLITDHPTSTYEVAGSRITDIRHDIGEIERVNSKSRGDPDNRAAIYEKELYDRWFETLLGHRGYLVRTARPAVLRRQEEMDQEVRGLRRRQCVMLLVSALVGAVVSLLATNIWTWLV